ncbi:hypothetical protein GMB86_07070 [Terrilactibacillus sp. BCM23-1]|uniref:Uncharacterized protein n=1 Tax=Terrilactibacillus tamarindi TaxID=2599694 RepID=A0A6N8CNQ2_9BACI|nr:hypothetical protein [Terrilactibacillus tamarindi]MTT31774.1 hypothetical protein [Terrilactibacillus tamarindi]
MMRFMSFSGYVTMIRDFPITTNDEGSDCYKMISVDNGYGKVVNFIAGPTTYFVDHAMITVGDAITGFYDGDAIVPLIYPPQYQAIVITKNRPYQNVKVDFFDSQLVSRDGHLKLNLSPFTQVLLVNGQAFTKNPANRNLIVTYGPTSRSIPPQTTPYKIIVIC